MLVNFVYLSSPLFVAAVAAAASGGGGVAPVTSMETCFVLFFSPFWRRRDDRTYQRTTHNSAWCRTAPSSPRTASMASWRGTASATNRAAWSTSRIESGEFRTAIQFPAASLSVCMFLHASTMGDVGVLGV